MRTVSSLLVVASAVLFSSVAGAEQAPAPPRDAGAAAGAAAGSAACDLGEATGVDANRARGWVHVMCDELAHQGVRAATGVTSTTTYRLHVHQLDKKMMVRVSVERPDGSSSGSERAVVSDADELVVVMPRLVKAISQGVSFKDTATTGSLTYQEVRPALKKSGEMMAGGGLFGGSFVGSGHGGVPAGLVLALTYETQAMAAVLELRPLVTGDDGNKEASWLSLSLGTRHFLTDSDVTPFLGGGVAISGGTFRNGSEEKTGSGLGAYAEVGVEALRMHKGRLVASVRADVPFYSMKVSDYSYPMPMGGPMETSQPDKTSSYVLPLSLSVSYYFH